MGLAEQIAAWAAAPFAPLRLRGRALALLLVYVLAAAGLLALTAALLLAHQDDLRKALLSYLFPESWHFAADLLVTRFLASQSKAVIVNAAVSGTLVGISVLLFPLKEKVSAAFERESALTTDPIDEFPLWRQALEEGKLVFIYLTAQLSIFWLGYPPDPTRRKLALVLSFLYLFCTFTIDFAGPLFQRHKLSYARILELFAWHPLLLVGFGALLTLPAVLTGLYVTRHPQLSLQTAIITLFSANLVCIVWGVVSGTWLASKLLPAGLSTKEPHALTRAVFALVVVALFAVNARAFSSVALALHHKSQILKCSYRILPSTLRFARPSLGGLLRGKVNVGVRFDLRIENPTPHDVAIEKNRLEVRHGEALVATGRLSPMAVPAGQKRVQTLDLRVDLHPSVLLKGRALLRDKWTVTLLLEVADGLEFPIYLRHSLKKAIDKQLRGVK